MKSIKKRFFTLLEVLIALALSLVIMTSLFTAYFQSQKITYMAQEKEEALFPLRTTQKRLEELFYALITPNQKNTFFVTEQGSNLFLPGSQSLLFSFDNGVVVVPMFSGSALGKLGVDTKGRLILLTWPDKGSWPEDKTPSPHLDVLMDGVKGLAFMFYSLDPKDLGWKKEWTKEMKALPALIQIEIQKGEQKLTYSFPVPQVMGVVRLGEGEG